VESKVRASYRGFVASTRRDANRDVMQSRREIAGTIQVVIEVAEDESRRGAASLFDVLRASYFDVCELVRPPAGWEGKWEMECYSCEFFSVSLFHGYTAHPAARGRTTQIRVYKCVQIRQFLLSRRAAEASGWMLGYGFG